jgi:hypothetical protein
MIMVETVVSDEDRAQVLEVLGHLRDVVEEFGANHVYQRPPQATDEDDEDDVAECWYVHADAAGNLIPGCLAGHVLARMGVSLAMLQEYERMNINNMSLDPRSPVATLLRKPAQVILQTAQGHQDDDGTWGFAYELAKEKAWATYGIVAP